MLIAKYGSAECGITVPYGANFEGLKRNSGFIDIRGRPDLAVRILEAAHSDSLKALLIALADPAAPVFTVGCDLGTRHKDEGISDRSVAGGYIHVMHSSFASTSADEYLVMAQRISDHVDAKSDGRSWELHHLYTAVDFQLGRSGIVPSIQIWFDAEAETSAAAWLSREALLNALREALTT